VLSWSEHGRDRASAAHVDAAVLDFDARKVTAFDRDVERRAAHLHVSVARVDAETLAGAERRDLHVNPPRLEDDELIRGGAHSPESRARVRGDRAVIPRRRLATGRLPEPNGEHGQGR
jgi:hypothetical protein